MLTMVKMFVESTEQLLVETGMTREQTTEWKLKIRDGRVVTLALILS
jgi:hypothetical protein